MIRTTPETRDWLKSHFDPHVIRIQEFLRQATVPSDGVGIREGADLLARYFREIGCQEVELVEGYGEPGVWAYYNAAAPLTLMVYAMFDTKPADERKWSSPPFHADIIERPAGARAVQAPGARGRKAPLLAFLGAVEALRAVDGQLPVNLIFLAEGEENIGSPRYSRYIERYADRLAMAVACICPGANQDATGRATLNLGSKGLVLARIVARGTSMGLGPQAAPSHSMAQTVVASPVWHLIEALGTIATEDGRTVQIDGFYDRTRPMSDLEASEVKGLASASPENWWSAIPGVRDAVVDSKLGAEGAWERYLYWPSFNISGIQAGYVGPGTPMFTVSNEAAALVDIRLPHGFVSDQVIAAVQSHLKRSGYADVAFEVIAAHDPWRTDADSFLVRLVSDLVEEHGVELRLVPSSAGGGPWSEIRNRFDIPVLFDVGLGYGGNAGEADEFLVTEMPGSEEIAGLVEAEVFYAEFLRRLGPISTANELEARATRTGSVTVE